MCPGWTTRTVAEGEKLDSNILHLPLLERCAPPDASPSLAAQGIGPPSTGWPRRAMRVAAGSTSAELPGLSPTSAFGPRGNCGILLSVGVQSLFIP
jgi:hypothetical protein